LQRLRRDAGGVVLAVRKPGLDVPTPVHVNPINFSDDVAAPHSGARPLRRPLAPLDIVEPRKAAHQLEAQLLEVGGVQRRKVRRIADRVVISCGHAARSSLIRKTASGGSQTRLLAIHSRRGGVQTALRAAYYAPLITSGVRAVVVMSTATAVLRREKGYPAGTRHGTPRVTRALPCGVRWLYGAERKTLDVPA
jgi:hypothetical protein